MSASQLRSHRREAAGVVLLGVLLSVVGSVGPSSTVHSPTSGGTSAHASGIQRIRIVGTHSAAAKSEPTNTNSALPSMSRSLTTTRTITIGVQMAIRVKIPQSEGVFTMTVSDPPIELSAVVPSADKTSFESTGLLGAVTISDSRFQRHPGWIVSGQVGDVGSDSFDDNVFGWTPAVIEQNAAHDVVAGPFVPPGADPGLTGGSALAHASPTHGLGTTVLGASVDLQIPVSAPGSAYSPTLTLTALDAG